MAGAYKKTAASAQKTPDEFAERVIKMIQEGVAPWQKEWKAGEYFAPLNPVSGTVYRGLNHIVLSEPGLADPRWMTFKQAKDKGYWIKKGSRATPIVFWQWTEEVERKDDAGRPVIGFDGKPETETLRLDRPRVYHYQVFHASQLETEDRQLIPAYEPPPLEWSPVERAEAILKESGAVIVHDQRDRAYYSPASDEIHLPYRENFSAAGNYYSTVLHELGHWACSKRRLDMEGGRFGSESYCQEELRVEIASWMLCQELRLDFTPENNAAYVAHWVRNLKDDPYEIVRACRDAEKIREYLISLEIKKAQEASLDFSDIDAPEWAGNLTRPENFEPMRPDLLALDLGASSSDLKALGDFYQELLNTVDEILDDQMAGQFSAEDRRRMLSAMLLDAQLAHNKMIGLGMLKPEARFPRQGWLESVSGAEKFGSPQSEQHLSELSGEAIPAAGAGNSETINPVPAPEPDRTSGLDRPQSRPERRRTKMPTLSPQEEFAQTLKDAGFLIDGYPVMDGKIHRVRVIGGNPGSKDGAYCGYLDGVKPAGWYANHKEGGQVTIWVASGHQLTDEEFASLRAESAERQARHKQELEASYQDAAERALKKLFAPGIGPADPGHAYLKAKGVKSHGLYQDGSGNLLAAGLNLKKSDFLGLRKTPPDQEAPQGPPRSHHEFEARRVVQTLQTISPEGRKRFEPGTRKKGAAFVIGEHLLKKIAFDHWREKKNTQPLLQDLQPKPKILLAEGYATSATLHEATGLPVVAAFDAGNLKPVAELLQEKFPGAGIVVCADNDHRLGVNIGLEKAQEAALAVNGRMIFPEFSQEEKNRGLTDFNDLALSRGFEAAALEINSLCLSMKSDQDKTADTPDQNRLTAGKVAGRF